MHRYVIVFNTITVMSLEIISKEYADSTFASGPVVKTITSSDGSVSVFTDGPNVDLKVNGGGGAVALDDVKAKVFNFGLRRNGNDWLFGDGGRIVSIFKSLDGLNHVEIGVFSFDDANWGPLGSGGNTDSFYSQPVTIYFSKETSINEILSNFDDSLIQYNFNYAYPLAYIAGNY